MDDSGSAGDPLVIQGPTAAGKTALLDRNNTSSGSYVSELLDADYVELRNLSITAVSVGGRYMAAKPSG